MEGLHQISTAIESGDIDVGIAAGVEDMFSVPQGGFAPDFHLNSPNRNTTLVWAKALRYWPRREIFPGKTREKFSINSHKKALAAIADGKFDNELISIDKYGECTIDTDEGPREPTLIRSKA
ncbi:MAG: hypothetical protein CM1200mP10_11530 [Candidatus Neomarinimicrobiota bacterium]|nr:MAG: hypothetical protein CM1200mP10_11530 [Candidatus Neomarinimicrobiota bacterium]